jgi:hypothetical protein
VSAEQRHHYPDSAAQIHPISDSGNKGALLCNSTRARRENVLSPRGWC